MSPAGTTLAQRESGELANGLIKSEDDGRSVEIGSMNCRAKIPHQTMRFKDGLNSPSVQIFRGNEKQLTWVLPRLRFKRASL